MFVVDSVEHGDHFNIVLVIYIYIFVYLYSVYIYIFTYIIPRDPSTFLGSGTGVSFTIVWRVKYLLRQCLDL